MKLLTKIKQFFKSLFRKVDELKNKYLPIAVNAVQIVKKAIDNGTADTIVDIVKIVSPDVGDAILDKVLAYVRKRIPQLCIQLEILNAYNLSVDGVDALEAALNALKDVYGEKWEEFTSGLAGDILVMLEDGKIDSKEAKELAKLFYDKYVKNVE